MLGSFPPNLGQTSLPSLFAPREPTPLFNHFQGWYIETEADSNAKRSVAPPGLGCLIPAGPTAYAVGYYLPPLRG